MAIMNVSTCLLQPLSINTDIVYDLDMSKFPGVDDPQHMFQPALVISTPETRGYWLSVLEKTEPEEASTDDLFQLIESCPVESILDYSSNPDSGHIQNFFDDVIDSATTSLSSDEGISLSDSPWDVPYIHDCQDLTNHDMVPSPSYYEYESHRNVKRKREPSKEDPRKTQKVLERFSLDVFVDTFDMCEREA